MYSCHAVLEACIDESNGLSIVQFHLAHCMYWFPLKFNPIQSSMILLLRSRFNIVSFTYVTCTFTSFDMADKHIWPENQTTLSLSHVAITYMWFRCSNILFYIHSNWFGCFCAYVSVEASFRLCLIYFWPFHSDGCSCIRKDDCSTTHEIQLEIVFDFFFFVMRQTLRFFSSFVHHYGSHKRKDILFSHFIPFFFILFFPCRMLRPS